MMPIDLLTTVVPQANAILSFGAGAMATLGVLVALGLTAVLGAAHELRRTDRSTSTRPVYATGAARAPRLAA